MRTLTSARFNYFVVLCVVVITNAHLATTALSELPTVPHYDLPPTLSAPTLKPITKPHYANADRDREAGGNEKNDQGGNLKTLWESLVSPNDPLVFLNLCLVFVTGGLAVSTFGLWLVTWKSGVRQSEDMRASIRIAERTITEVERPYVYILEIEPPYILTKDGTREITYVVGNYGKTPGRIDRVRAAITNSNTDFPDRDPEEVEDRHALLGYVVQSDTKITDIPQEMSSDIPLTVDHTYACLTPLEGERLFIWIIIEYSGPFTTGHGTSACWVLEGYPAGFRRLLDDRYTYMK